MIGALRPIIRALVPHPLRRRARDLYPYLRYAGFRVRCPCCGGLFRKFLPGGRDNRPDAACPGCGCLERHRLLWLYLQSRRLLAASPLAMLHLAPERIIRRRLEALSNIRYVSADLDSPLARIKADITSLPFRDGTFDCVLCNHVLEHIPDDAAAMRELYRVLKPGGWGIFQVPIDLSRDTFEDPTIEDPKARTELFGQEDHVRIYGRDYPLRLGRVGFTVMVDPYARRLPSSHVRSFGLMAHEDTYFCVKPAPADPRPCSTATRPCSSARPPSTPQPARPS